MEVLNKSKILFGTLLPVLLLLFLPTVCQAVSYSIQWNIDFENKTIDRLSVDNKNTSNAGEYLVDHSASMVLINPDGKIAAIFKPKQEIGEVPSIDGEKLISDFEKIVRLYN